MVGAVNWRLVTQRLSIVLYFPGTLRRHFSALCRPARGDLLERRQRLMHDWAAYCRSGKDARSKGKVVALR